MSTDRLEAIRSELNGILEDRLAELRSALDQVEETTRRIVSAELEIARARQLGESLEEQAERIAEDAAALRVRGEEARARYDARVKERDEVRDEVKLIEEETAELQSKIEELRGELRAGEAQHERLSQEHQQLQGKFTALQTEIERMRKLKAELMSSIQANMKELSGTE